MKPERAREQLLAYWQAARLRDIPYSPHRVWDHFLFQLSTPNHPSFYLVGIAETYATSAPKLKFPLEEGIHVYEEPVYVDIPTKLGFSLTESANFIAQANQSHLSTFFGTNLGLAMDEYHESGINIYSVNSGVAFKIFDQRNAFSDFHNYNGHSSNTVFQYIEHLNYLRTDIVLSPLPVFEWRRMQAA